MTRVRLLGILCCLGLILGCGTRWVRSPVVKQEHMQVSLEYQKIEGRVAQQQFNHPREIEKEKLAQLMSRLQYLKKPLIYGEAEKAQVFQAEEIERLVPALIEGLKTAGPNQRIRFISYSTGGGLLFKKQRRTGGVLFVDQAGRLNLAFSYINFTIKDEEVRRGIADRLYTDPLAINTADSPLLTPGDAIDHRRIKGEEMPLWIVAELEKIEPNRIRKERGAAAGGIGQKASPALPKTESEPPADAGDRTDPPPKAPAAAAPELDMKSGPEPAAAKEVPEDQWELRKDEIKKKLQYLKDLHESELINTREYEAQKKKLLEQIQ